jgi:hypothetical protein
MLHGVSSGIVPSFLRCANRRYRKNNVWKEQLVVDPPIPEEYFDEKKPLDGTRWRIRRNSERTTSRFKPQFKKFD